jgi:chromate transporter
MNTQPYGGSSAAPPHASSHRHSISLGEAFRVWLKIGLTSFGGPAGQIALMHKVLVEEKRWVGENRFLHALNYCMLLPGPEAQQLAVYIGWLLHGTLGGLIAGILFVLPGALVILLFSILYAGFHDLTLVQAIFFGIKPAVLAVVIEAVLRIGKRALKNAYMYSIAGSAFFGLFFMNLPFPLIIASAGLIGYIGGQLKPDSFVVIKGHSPQSTHQTPVIDTLLDAALPDHVRPSFSRSVKVLTLSLILWFGPLLAIAIGLGTRNVYFQEGWFFSKMAVVTFGGAYAVLSYVAQTAVESFHWLTPGEMLDGLGLAETTPGPLILVLQFVGFLAAFRNPGALDPMLAGVLGATITIWMTFVPCFLWIFLGAPYIETVRGNQSLSSVLSAITAAVVGVVLNLAVWFGLHTIFAEARETLLPLGLKLSLPVWHSIHWPIFILAIGASLAMLRFKVGMIPTLAACAAVGAIYFFING